MSDWLERKLARELAPVAAPDILRIRLGFAPAKRWEFPRVALAVAAAVVMIIAGGYAASRTAALDLRQLAARELRGTETVEFASTDPVAIAAWLRREAGVDVPLRPADGVHLTGARLIRRYGVRVAAISLQVNAGKATVLIAHAGPAVEGTPACKISDHALAAAPEAGCHLCHSL
jgi:hypothetical protein